MKSIMSLNGISGQEPCTLLKLYFHWTLITLTNLSRIVSIKWDSVVHRKLYYNTTSWIRSGSSLGIRLSIIRRQCGQVVRAPDLKSRGPRFMSCSDHYLELFHCRPQFNSSTTLVHGQLDCLLPVGIFNPFKYLFLIFECSAPLAPCYDHLPRANKGHVEGWWSPAPRMHSVLSLHKNLCSTLFVSLNPGV